MSVILLSRDLMTTSRVAGAASRLQTSIKTTNNGEQVAAFCAENQAGLVLIDLTVAPLNIAALVAAVKQLENSPTIVAFGPHVHAETLNAAEAAGCDAVLTRGQFFADMDSVLAQAAGQH